MFIFARFNPRWGLLCCQSAPKFHTHISHKCATASCVSSVARAVPRHQSPPRHSHPLNPNTQIGPPVQNTTHSHRLYVSFPQSSGFTCTLPNIQNQAEFRPNSKPLRDPLGNVLNNHLEVNKQEISNRHEPLKSLEHEGPHANIETTFLIAARTISRWSEAATVPWYLITGRLTKYYGENFIGILC